MRAALRETGPPPAVTDRPCVSIVVPTRDYARYLPEAIASVQAQTLTSWECIVVDDGSVDRTPALLEDLSTADPRIRVIRQPAAGASAARNAGLAMASGTYVQFLDADDLLHPSKLASHASALAANPDIGVVIGRTAYMMEADGAGLRRLDAPRADVLRPGSTISGQEMLDLLLLQSQFVIEAPLVRRAVLSVPGPFDEHLARMEDWDLWLRLALVGVRFSFVPSPEPIATVRVHAASSSQQESAMLRAEVAVRERLGPNLADHPISRESNDRRIEQRRMELAVLGAMDGHVLAGVRVLLPLAVRARRARWLAWALLLPVANVVIGRRFVARLWAGRRSGTGGGR